VDAVEEAPASTSIAATRDDAADIDGEVKEGVGDEKDNDEDDCVDEVLGSTSMLALFSKRVSLRTSTTVLWYFSTKHSRVPTTWSRVIASTTRAVVNSILRPVVDLQVTNTLPVTASSTV